VSLPTLLGLVLQPPDGDDRTLSDLAAVAWPFMMLAVAVGLAAHQLACGSPVSGWLAAATAVPPVAVGLMSLATTVAPATAASTGSRSVGLVSGAVAVGLAALAGRASSPPRDPLLLGLAGGATAGMVAVATSSTPAAGVPWDSDPVAWCFALVALSGVAVQASRTVLRASDLPRPTRYVLFAGAGAMAVEVAAGPWLASWPPGPVASAGLRLLAVACFLAVALHLVNLVGDAARHGHDRDLLRLRWREDDLRRARSTLHEARSTVAGIVSATRLMNERDDLPDDTRRRLLAMEQAEVERLQRVLAEAGPGGGPVADLTDALGPVVDSVRARGHQVDLHATRGQLHEDADEVARIVHLLLDNAATHGHGPIDVTLECQETDLRISVTDAGPGVPADLRDRVFDWGVSGAGSTGIGLHDGLSRAEALGGRLCLGGAASGPTRFDLVLPRTTGSVR
jgi:signal transduction histidine kinase